MNVKIFLISNFELCEEIWGLGIGDLGFGVWAP